MNYYTQWHIDKRVKYGETVWWHIGSPAYFFSMDGYQWREYFRIVGDELL